MDPATIIAHISFLTTAITVTYNPISQIVIVFVEFYLKTQLCQFMINPNSVCNSFDIAMAMALLRRFKQYHHNLRMSFKSPTLYAYPDLSQLSWISHSYWPFEILSQCLCWQSLAFIIDWRGVQIFFTTTIYFHSVLEDIFLVWLK